ncbi:hypothetical protein PFISCL1PPCAC_12594, partial [Pristionchus fissidentatus]
TGHKRERDDVSQNLEETTSNKATCPNAPSSRAIRLANRQSAVKTTSHELTPYYRRKKRKIEEAKSNFVLIPSNAALGHSEYVSARSIHRRVLAAVLNGDKEKMAELINDPRMPLDAITTQYSFADDRTPIMEAFATGNVDLIMTMLIALAEKRKKGVDTTRYEPISAEVISTTSECGLSFKIYEACEVLREPLLSQLI